MAHLPAGATHAEDLTVVGDVGTGKEAGAAAAPRILTIVSHSDGEVDHATHGENEDETACQSVISTDATET